MAERRMFSNRIVDTDAFLSLPVSAQNLYFHFGMRADDDGFVSSPRKIMSFVKSSDDDYLILIAKKFILPFESGICVIKHWRINNYLRADRYKETSYLDEKSALTLTDNGSYSMNNAVGIPSGIPLVDAGKDSIGEDSKGKDSIGECIGSDEPTAQKAVKHKYGKYKNILLTDAEYEKLNLEPNGLKAIEFLSEYIAEKAYKSKSHYLTIKRWVLQAVKERENKKPQEIDTPDFSQWQLPYD